MIKKTAFFLVIFSLCSVLSVFAVNFSELNLAQDDRLLFKAEFESQNAVFISTLQNNSFQQLTAFPEKLQLVDNGRTILATNRFGVARIPVNGGLPVPFPGYPSFAEGGIPLKGRMQEVAASNDGKWLLYIEPTSPAYGTLFLVNAANGVKHLVSEKVELPARSFPAKWSPDSRLFVYAKDGKLYYFPIISNLSVLVDERFRMMAAGNINSVEWGQKGDFYYINGNILYCVRSPELFTRTIYGDFLSIGSTAAVFPFDFDPGFDNYYIAPDSSSVLINKNNKSIFMFMLGDRSVRTAIPHVSLQQGAENINVFWAVSNKERITIAYSVKNNIYATHFDISENNITTYHADTVPLSVNGALSPDGTRAIFWGKHGLELWDFAGWKQIQRIRYGDEQPVLSCVWINNTRFISGTSKLIEEVSISSGGTTFRRICLSGADEIGFELNSRGQRVLARLGSEWYSTDTRSSWTSANDTQLQPVSLTTNRFRVFLEPQSTGLFKNIIMVRNVQNVGTSSLLARHTVSRAYPQRTPMRIALCFDLYDDDTGLYHVLAALRRNNIKATFFLNGEFIRRNPASALAIAEAGHETASMFYATIDFSDSRYRITRDFITRGLARNEDEFNNAAGKELMLLWHPPYYRNSALISAAAIAAGYITVDRTIDLLDWVSREDTGRLNIQQIPVSQMIEQITENRRNNAVIPIRLGTLPGGRDEYLYQRIDVLLDALVRSNIEVVPVSHAVR